MSDLSHHGNDSDEHQHRGSSRGLREGNGNGNGPFNDLVCGIRVAADPAKEVRHQRSPIF